MPKVRIHFILEYRHAFLRQMSELATANGQMKGTIRDFLNMKAKADLISYLGAKGIAVREVEDD